MTTRNTSREEDLLQAIVGEQLSSVEFVQDYVQLRFDGPVLTAITQPVIQIGERMLRWGDPGFRDELCKRIARRVVSARIPSGNKVQISFDDGAVVEVSLK